MACEVPIVSTKCPSGPEEILEFGKYGRLVEIDDTKGLAIAMEEVISVNCLYRSDEKVKDFRISEISKDYIHLFSSLKENHGKYHAD